MAVSILSTALAWWAVFVPDSSRLTCTMPVVSGQSHVTHDYLLAVVGQDPLDEVHGHLRHEPPGGALLGRPQHQHLHRQEDRGHVIGLEAEGVAIYSS